MFVRKSSLPEVGEFVVIRPHLRYPMRNKVRLASDSERKTYSTNQQLFGKWMVREYDRPLVPYKDSIVDVHNLMGPMLVVDVLPEARLDAIYLVVMHNEHGLVLLKTHDVDVLMGT